ncbi:hypothetical protein M0812_27751 [Anaeramoeba flamelloides]|uniref:Uncharacterized protein n=1 Tax=Anaeramoeba flamelloides TaxID=1746091 RepID=A0AAV7Y9M8_9EUKA|nr:hypothetical protein M0812_27751 [Anaeramoeba flamelloides]
MNYKQTKPKKNLRTKKRKPERNRLSAKSYYPDQVEITSFGTATEKEQLALIDISLIRSQKMRMKRLYKAFPNDITRRWNNKRIEFSERMMNLLAYSLGQGRTNLRSCLGSYFKKKGFVNLTIRKKNTGILFVKNKCAEKEKKKQERKKQKEMEKRLNKNKKKQEKNKEKYEDQKNEIEIEKKISSLKLKKQHGKRRQLDQNLETDHSSSYKIRRKTNQFSKSPRNSVHINDDDLFAEIDQLSSKFGLNSFSDISFLLSKNVNVKRKSNEKTVIKEEIIPNNISLNFQYDPTFSSDENDDLSSNFESDSELDSNSDSCLPLQNKRIDLSSNLGDEKKDQNQFNLNVNTLLKNEKNTITINDNDNDNDNDNENRNENDNNNNNNGNSDSVSSSDLEIEFESESDSYLDPNPNLKNIGQFNSPNQIETQFNPTILDSPEYKLFDYDSGYGLNSPIIYSDFEDEFLLNSFVIDCNEI